MSKPSWPHTGAVLCGGAGTRMGRTKHDLVLAGGDTMLERTAGVLADVCRTVVIVGHPCPPAGWTCVADLRAGQGPLAGIEALLASGLDDDYLVCPCDVPRLTAEPLRALLEPTDLPATALRLESEPRVRPLPLRAGSETLPSIRRQLDEGRRAVHRWLETIEVHVVRGPSAWADALHDVDTPDDWAAMLDR